MHVAISNSEGDVICHSSYESLFWGMGDLCVKNRKLEFLYAKWCNV